MRKLVEPGIPVILSAARPTPQCHMTRAQPGSALAPGFTGNRDKTLTVSTTSSNASSQNALSGTRPAITF